MATSKDVCAQVVYGETATLRAPGGAGNEADLAAARRYIAGVVYARYEAQPGNFAPPQTPSATDLKDTAIKRHWELCNAAAEAAKGDDIGKCRHFVISWLNAQKDGPSREDTEIEDKWPFTEQSKITNKWGSFYRYKKSGLDRTDIFVLKYCGVI